MNKIKIPVIHNLIPTNLAKLLCEVQPMTSDVGEVFKKFKIQDASDDGSLKHTMREGWQRKYGSEWINLDLWLTIKIKGL